MAKRTFDKRLIDMRKDSIITDSKASKKRGQRAAYYLSAEISNLVEYVKELNSDLRRFRNRLKILEGRTLSEIERALLVEHALMLKRIWEIVSLSGVPIPKNNTQKKIISEAITYSFQFYTRELSRLVFESYTLNPEAALWCAQALSRVFQIILTRSDEIVSSLVNSP